MTDPGQLLQELEQAVDSIEQSSVSIADSAEIQSDVISGGINDFVTTPYGPVRTLSNAINVISQTNPTGAWQTATAYNLKDLVVEADIIYLCTFPHTSTSFAADLTAGYWAVYQTAITPSLPVLDRRTIAIDTRFSTSSSTYVNLTEYENTDSFAPLDLWPPSLMNGKTYLRVGVTGAVSGAGTVQFAITKNTVGTIFDTTRISVGNQANREMSVIWLNLTQTGGLTNTAIDFTSDALYDITSDLVSDSWRLRFNVDVTGGAYSVQFAEFVLMR